MHWPTCPRAGERPPRISRSHANPWDHDEAMTATLRGPPELEPLDGLIVTIRDHHPRRAQGASLAGGPAPKRSELPAAADVSHNPCGDSPRPQREREPPICANINSMSIDTLTVQIWVFCVPASRQREGPPYPDIPGGALRAASLACAQRTSWGDGHGGRQPSGITARRVHGEVGGVRAGRVQAADTG